MCVEVRGNYANVLSSAWLGGSESRCDFRVRGSTG